MFNLRAYLKKYSRTRVFRPIFRLVYRIIIFVEYCYEYSVDRLLSAPCHEESIVNVTAVIKTFERPKKCIRLIKSIRRLYPTLKIILVDDSANPIQKLPWADIELVVLPYDSGVSAGRQAGLDKVCTPYVLNLDDDFLFSRKTNLVSSIRYLQDNECVDIVAGEVAYLPYYHRFDYKKHSLIKYERAPIFAKGDNIAGLLVYEKCANFFLARTNSIQKIGWDSQLKRLDHADFYTRAYGKLVTVFNPKMELLHTPTHFDDHYLAIRHDYVDDAYVLNRRYGNKNIG